jgi:hypothetical protein
MKKQQGDVIIKSASSIPQGAKIVPARKRGFILAEGEETGHAHVINDLETEVFEKDGVIFIKTSKSINIIHEEHKPITIESGIWQVGIVKEYDPFTEEIRQVRD